MTRDLPQRVGQGVVDTGHKVGLAREVLAVGHLRAQASGHLVQSLARRTCPFRSREVEVAAFVKTWFLKRLPISLAEGFPCMCSTYAVRNFRSERRSA
jgi:hypothetical protein